MLFSLSNLSHQFRELMLITRISDSRRLHGFTIPPKRNIFINLIVDYSECQERNNTYIEASYCCEK